MQIVSIHFQYCKVKYSIAQSYSLIKHQNPQSTSVCLIAFSPLPSQTLPSLWGSKNHTLHITPISCLAHHYVRESPSEDEFWAWMLWGLRSGRGWSIANIGQWGLEKRWHFPLPLSRLRPSRVRPFGCLSVGCGRWLAIEVTCLYWVQPRQEASLYPSEHLSFWTNLVLPRSV